MFEHINGLNSRERFFERLKMLLAPEEFRALLRRLERKRARADRRAARHANYPYSSNRQCARYSRQGAEHLQRLSHKPGTVQPRHIFA